jgi:hypothetical protein
MSTNDEHFYDSNSEPLNPDDPTYIKCNEIGILVDYSDSHYLIAIKDILALEKNVTIWSGTMKEENGIVGNRRRDKKKINEIYEAIKNKTLATSIISASEFKKSDGLSSKICCWDGQHRYWALRKYYGDVKRMFDGTMFLIVYRNDKIHKMVERFKNINKGTSAQTQYSSNIAKNIIEAISGYIFKKYQNLNKPSETPRRPNYNKNNLESDLTSMIDDLDKKYIDTNMIQKCIDYVDIINTEFKDKYEKKFKNKIRAPWMLTVEIEDCYLFIPEFNFIETLKDKIINM